MDQHIFVSIFLTLIRQGHSAGKLIEWVSLRAMRGGRDGGGVSILVSLAINS